MNSNFLFYMEKITKQGYNKMSKRVMMRGGIT